MICIVAETISFLGRIKNHYQNIGKWETLNCIVILRHLFFYIGKGYFVNMARIMIAEDSEATRLLLRDSLQIGGHELVAEAANGVEAVEKFNETKPDLMLLDVAA